MTDRCVCDLYGPASCPTCRDDWQNRHPERVIVPCRQPGPCREGVQTVIPCHRD